MRRHKDMLHTSKISKRCVNCLEWGMYLNIKKMYTLVYKEMVVAGVARNVEDTYYDKLNNEFEFDNEILYGTFLNTKITDLSYIILLTSANLLRILVSGKFQA